ncbi:RE2 [Symbiodinium sp. CCMP2592]|nr:RE2 [Symbiodinium sp. CCMP2592]
MFTLMALRTMNLKSPTTRGPRQPGVEVRIPGGDTPDGKSGTSGSLGKTTTGAKVRKDGRTSEVPRGPSEKMVVPSFSGAVESGSEDIGASARSYMRQIAAWRRMTRIEPSRQALTLYQHLSGKAWIDAERLDVDKLAGDDGMEYFLGWVTDRYLDVQVTQVGRSLGDFFRRLRRQQGQSIRDYMSDFDRALARLQECGCHLPDIASAWVFVDRMTLDEGQELNLLASVQNEYNLKRLQQAAIVQDRNLRKPWEAKGAQPQRPDRGLKWWGRKPQQANLAEDGFDDIDDYGDGYQDAQSEGVPEHVAEELYTSYMAHESAKQRYKEISKLRGSDPEGMKQLAADRLKQAKAKSFCAGCRRKGHWHLDPECPLNQPGGGSGNAGANPGGSSRPTGPTTTPTRKDDDPKVKSNYPCQLVYVTWDLDEKVPTSNLTAITDTACSRSVAGIPWVEKYMAEAKRVGYLPQVVDCKDSYKFGASRIFDSTYAVVVSFTVGESVILLRVAVVNGDLPLLVSRPALAQMGMVMDVEENSACFKKLNVRDLKLLSTETGHPALPVRPFCVSAATIKSCDWKERELLIVPKTQQYTAYMVSLSFEDSRGPEAVPGPKVFYPKKISIEAYNLLTSDKVTSFSFIGYMLFLGGRSLIPVDGQRRMLNRSLLFFMSSGPFGQHRVLLARHSESFLKCTISGRALEANLHSRCCGSEELLSVEPPSPPVLLARPLMASRSPVLTAPTVTKQKGLWDLRRDELLLMEAEARGLTIHEKWTVPEIRSIIQEDMKRSAPATEIGTGEAVPLTKMTIKELENALEASGIAIPEKANKGMLMRMLRDQGGRGPQTVLSYRRWAVQEVSENDGAQEDLKMFAAWASRALEITDGYANSSVPPPYVDSEHSARIPYNPESFGGSSWDVVPTRSTTTTRTTTRPKARPTRAENEVIEQRIQAQRRQAPPSSLGSLMDQEIDPQVMDEIQYLQARLAVLRDRHGMAPSGEAILAGLSETNADLIRFLKFKHLICFVKMIFVKIKEILPEDLLYYLNLFDHEIILKPFLALRVLVTRTPVEPIAILADFLVILFLRHYPYQVIQFPVTRTPMEPVAILADFLEIYMIDEGTPSTGPLDASGASLEEAAQRLLKEKRFSLDELALLLPQLPMKPTSRHRCINGDPGDKTQSFLGGMWTHGGLHGISRGTALYPKFVSYVNEVMKRASPVKDIGWSSFVIHKDVATCIHRDSHNLAETPVLTVSLGDFSGGCVWVERDRDDDPLHLPVEWRPDRDGNPLPGYLASTKGAPYLLDPRRRHATEPWTGERWVISCFTTRSFPSAGGRLRDGLREVRFPLRKLPPTAVKENEEYARTSRPIKSTRKALWQNARRIIALTVWCSIAASACVLPAFPESRGPDAVTLLEIGGDYKTFEATEHGYVTTEPLYEEHFRADHNLSTTTAILDELRPRRLWIHLSSLGDQLERLLAVAQRQLAAGRTVVLEGKPEDSSWSSEELLALADFYDYKWTHRSNGSRVLHLNPTETFGEDGDNEIPVETFQRYLLRDEGADGGEEAYVVDRKTGRAPDSVLSPELEGAKAISFSVGSRIKKEVQSSLKRLHQNLGHPLNEDLARHLRIAGAGSEVVEAVKRMRCQVCERNKRAGSARPASLPTILDFNQIVAVDAFSAYDSNRRRHEFMMVTDFGTGFSLAGSLSGHSTQTMEADFCRIWSNTFGAPGTIALDLESGLQAGLGRFSEWHGTKLRPSAGQAHFQQGSVERAIQTWKEIWKKLVDQQSVGHGELQITVTAINSAVNTLKKQSGFSAAQAVWGRDATLPEDLLETPPGEQIDHILTYDRRRSREMAIRLGAKEAYFKNQNDAKLRRALLQRSRVAGPEVQIVVYFYRKPKNCKDWRWIGPATVIGLEGPNYWTSFAGRCHLVAREHLRMATGEEVGSAFTLRTTREDLERLLDRDFAEDEIYVGDDRDVGGNPPLLPGDPGVPLGDGSVHLPGDPQASQGDVEMPYDGDYENAGEPHRSPRMRGAEEAPGVRKRRRRKGPPPHLGHELPLVPDSPLPSGDDLPIEGAARASGDRPQEAHMLKLPKTARGREKALEKELPWSFIPSDQHEAFKAAERKQWLEHYELGALEPLSVSESRRICQEKGDRILGSRFAYRDKHWCKRKQDEALPWKPKARLVIAGHRDPDLSSGLSTHAPTISRQGIFLLLQILASNLDAGWTGHAGDVSSAFLCGQELQRELYLRQPKVGLGDLHPEQLLRIKRPVFGLVDSPSSWWDTLRQTLQGIEMTDEAGKRWHIRQCTLDHCIFMVQEVLEPDETGAPRYGSPKAFLGVHVDDILLVGMDSLCSLIKKTLSTKFPIPEWETGSFEYVGSYIDIKPHEIKISQSSYVKTRLFEIEVGRDQKDWEAASDAQRHDNMSLVGGLSWLSSQTRPDLQVGVSLSQQCQKTPTIGDIRFSNMMARRACDHMDEGILIRPVPLDQAVLLCYHDAGWANCPQSDEDPYYALTPEENTAGTMLDGPYDFHLRKAKRTNSCIASQLGGLYLLADRAILHGGCHKVSILDWKSSACDRVCRSTFAAETMGCATSIETGEYILRFLQTLVDGRLARSNEPLRYEVRFLSDCKSLYDTLTRDGIPRPPSCKRLAIDLAAIRDDLKSLGRLVWVPTTAQYADHLTKPLKAALWWESLKKGLILTFKEKEDISNQCKSVKLFSDAKGPSL